MDVDSKPKVYTYDAYMKAIQTAVKMYPEGIKAFPFLVENL